MDLKQQLMTQAFKLMQDPRVARALQNPRVMQGVVGAMQLGARVQKNITTGTTVVARSLNLATTEEVAELRTTIDRLERELADTRSGGGRAG